MQYGVRFDGLYHHLAYACARQRKINVSDSLTASKITLFVCFISCYAHVRPDGFLYCFDRSYFVFIRSRTSIAIQRLEKYSLPVIQRRERYALPVISCVNVSKIKVDKRVCTPTQSNFGCIAERSSIIIDLNILFLSFYLIYEKSCINSSC